MELDCTVGNYCRSVAFSTVLRHYGYPLSEAMCFGLSAAFDFSSSETRFGRHGEKKLICCSGSNSNDVYYLADLLRLELRILQTKTSGQALRLIDQIVNREQMPLIARVCIKEYLSCLKSAATNHVRESEGIFNIIDSRPSNHVTVISKLDRKQVTIHEPNLMEPSLIPQKVFCKALNPKIGVVSPSANTFYLLRPTVSFETLRPEMPDLAAKAICDNMNQYLSGNSKHYGISALNCVSDLIKDGMTAEEQGENLAMFRFFCDVVTGGGFYRRLYSRFLKEVNVLYFQNDELARCAQTYGRLSQAWSKLGKRFLSADIRMEKVELQVQIQAIVECEWQAAQELYQTGERIRNEL